MHTLSLICQKLYKTDSKKLWTKKIQKVIKNVILFLNNVKYKSFILKTYHSNKLYVIIKFMFFILKTKILAKEYFSKVMGTIKF